jgi:hypothetical protein
MPTLKHPFSREALARLALKEDGRSLKRRVRRAAAIQKMIGVVPDGMLFYGGFEAMQAYREAQATFINGCFIGCVLLCQVAVEHTLAGFFKLEGRDDVASASFRDMLRAAVPRYVTEKERTALDSVRTIRNRFVHAERAGRTEGALFRAVAAHRDPRSQLEKEAKTALLAMLRVFHEQPSTPRKRRGRP